MAEKKRSSSKGSSTKTESKRPSSRTRAKAEKNASTPRTRRGTVTTRDAGVTPAATTDVRKVAPEDADDPRALPRPSGPPSMVELDEARRAEANRAVDAGMNPQTPFPRDLENKPG